MTFSHVLISCEHGGCRVPTAWRALFRGAQNVLASHRGWDPGALQVARRLAKGLDAPLFFAEVSRLLIELNRSPGHPRLYSEFTRHLPPADQAEIAATCYWPYRQAVEAELTRLSRDGAVLHLSVHSFTPVLDGEVRQADIGLLYDPRRKRELRFADALAASLKEQSAYRVRRNYPYRGVSDGFTTYLRRQLGAKPYAGIELEMNQALDVNRYGRTLLAALQSVLG